MSDLYHLRIVSDSGVVEAGYDLPRVSRIIDTVWSSSFSSAAYWGYNLAVEALRPKSQDRTKQSLRTKGLDPNSRRYARAGEGTGAHRYLHHLATGGDLGTATGYEAGVARYWDDHGGIEVAGAERTVVSLRRRYAGTLDLALRDPVRGLTIVDLKTRPRLDVREKDKVQVAAYVEAWYEMFDELAGVGYVLLVDDHGKYVLRSVDLERYARAWHGTLEVYNALYGDGKGV